MTANRAAALALSLHLLACGATAEEREPPPPDPSGRETLVPGEGFSTPTPQPEPVGNGPGLDAKAIARWNVVPFQTFDGTFQIGVVAFHMRGIDRVEFSVDGGEWKSADGMRPNDRNGVWEYGVVLRAKDFEDGPLEVRAVVRPRVGVARVLAGEIQPASALLGEHSMFLNANSRGTLPRPKVWVDGNAGDDESGDGTPDKPFRTPTRAVSAHQQREGDCEGLEVLCRAGRYSWGPTGQPAPETTHRWLSVRAAPGVPVDQVVFDTEGRFGFATRLIRAHGITVSGETRFVTGGQDRFLWVDGCTLAGPGPTSGVTPFRWRSWTGTYFTDSHVHSYHDAVSGAMLVRRVRVSNLGSDAFSNSVAVLDCTADDIDARGSKAHPDVYMFYGKNRDIENVVVFGLRATNANCQGIFAATTPEIRDVALVNVLIAMPYGSERVSSSQWNCPVNHLVMRCVTIPNQSFAWRTSAVRNLTVVGCVFRKMNLGKGRGGGFATIPTIGFAHNHFVDTDSFGAGTFGESFTTGDPRFVDPSNDDYRPAPDSPLRNRVSSPITPVDASGKKRSGNSGIGALD